MCCWFASFRIQLAAVNCKGCSNFAEATVRTLASGKYIKTHGSVAKKACAPNTIFTHASIAPWPHLESTPFLHYSYLPVVSSPASHALDHAKAA